MTGVQTCALPILHYAENTTRDLRTEKHLLQASLGRRELEIMALRKEVTETIDKDKLLKINSVIMYNTLKYQVLSGQYKRKGPAWNTIHMVYTLLGEDGERIDVPHSKIIEEGYVYVFKTK